VKLLLMDITQKPTQEPYFSKDVFVETPMFGQTVT